MQSTSRSQASLDLLISYGVAILLISVSIYVVLQLGVFNTRLAPQYCNAAPSFVCDGYTLSTGGTLTLIMAQATGGTLNITGIACASNANSIGMGPQYGNVHVLPYKIAPQYYPTNQLINGLLMYSSNETRINIYCYSGQGLAKGPLGGTFSGMVWINYTISDLPSNYINIQQVMSFTSKYSVRGS